MTYTHDRCKICGLGLTTMAVPKRLVLEAEGKRFRPIKNVHTWLERDVCVCCDFVDYYTGALCRHRREQKSDPAPSVDKVPALPGAVA